MSEPAGMIWRDGPWAEARWRRDWAAANAREGRTRECPRCDGHGEVVTAGGPSYFDPPDVIECRACDGRGKVSPATHGAMLAYLRAEEEDRVLGREP